MVSQSLYGFIVKLRRNKNRCWFPDLGFQILVFRAWFPKWFPKIWFLNQKMVSQNMVSQSLYGFIVKLRRNKNRCWFPDLGFQILVFRAWFPKWFPKIWFLNHRMVPLYGFSIIIWFHYMVSQSSYGSIIWFLNQKMVSQNMVSQSKFGKLYVSKSDKCV